MQDLSAAELLVRLYRQGVTLRVLGDRLRVKAPPAVLSQDLRQALTTHKPKLVELLAFADEYRTLLRNAFRFLATGSESTTEEDQRFVDQQARLVDELGPALATEICLMTGRSWRKETAICPWCDEAGNCREPTASA
jgi:hypothetical protein